MLFYLALQHSFRCFRIKTRSPHLLQSLDLGTSLLQPEGSQLRHAGTCWAWVLLTQIGTKIIKNLFQTPRETPGDGRSFFCSWDAVVSRLESQCPVRILSQSHGRLDFLNFTLDHSKITKSMKIPRVLPHKLTPAAAPTSTGSLEHGVITSPSASSSGESLGSHWEISVISVLNWVNCPTRFSQECRSERRRSCSYQVLKMNPVWLFCVTDLSDVPRSESRRSQDGKATFRWCREKRDTVIANDPTSIEKNNLSASCAILQQVDLCSSRGVAFFHLLSSFLRLTDMKFIHIFMIDLMPKQSNVNTDTSSPQNLRTSTAAPPRQS